MKLFGACLLLLLFLTRFADGQIKETVIVELVEIFVSALNSEGHPVEDLSSGDFILKVDRKQQQITNFSRLLNKESEVPLTLVFLVDTSGSMNERGRGVRRIDLARSFAKIIMKEAKPIDRMQVFSFDTVLRDLTPMTSSIELMERTLSAVDVPPAENPGTALLAALTVTADRLKNEWGRKIILLLSDGENNVRGPKLDDLFQDLNKKDITVLSMGTTDIRNWEGRTTHFSTPIASDPLDVPLVKPSDKTQKAKRLLRLLADHTGGYSVFPGEEKELDDSMDKLRHVLRSQYMLGFKPREKPAHPSLRKMELECLRKGVKLRYRKTYFL